MNLEVGTKSLISTSEFFVAPNGKQYKSIYGTIKGVFSSKETLGVETNNKSTNWYVEIGNMTVAGCQIHYAIKAVDVNLSYAMNYTTDTANGIKEFQQPSLIYNADEYEIFFNEE